MSVHFEFDHVAEMGIMTVEGEMDFRTTLKALADLTSGSGFDPRYKLLADWTRAKFAGSLEEVWELASRAIYVYQGVPTRIALVVSNTDLYRFGRAAAFRLEQENGPHLEVFSSLLQARTWLRR